MSTLVFPIHDPKGIEIEFLKRCLPVLKENFNKAYISVTPATEKNKPETVEWLKSEDFFKVLLNKEDSEVGEHFMRAIDEAVLGEEPNEMLHIVNLDRIAYAILNFKDEFFKDINEVNKSGITTFFTRSEKAWSTHPQNYRAAEAMLTAAGKVLWGREYDFGWCQTAIRTKTMKEVASKVTSKNWTVLAEVVYELRNELRLKEVDWLSWEDPFILNRDPIEYKKEREEDPAEMEKRMGYVTPMTNYIFEKFKELNNNK